MQPASKPKAARSNVHIANRALSKDQRRALSIARVRASQGWRNEVAGWSKDDKARNWLGFDRLDTKTLYDECVSIPKLTRKAPERQPSW
jgi:hypothetical protein